jgi:death-on-curing protein
LRVKGLLESAVFRPQIGHYNSIAEEAAALMESLANGNKRIAFAAAHTFLLVNGYELELDPLVAYDFMMRSIARGEFRFAPILKWISDHIRHSCWPANR